MREENFLDAMSFLDEELIEETNQVRQGKACTEAQKEEPLWMKWRKGLAVIAAVWLVCIGISNLMTEDKGELIYGETFKGTGGGIIHNLEDLSLINEGVAWNKDGAFLPATLPVYKNLSYHIAGEPSGLTDAQMTDMLEETAGALGLEITQVEKEVNPRNPEATFYCYTSIGKTRINVEADGLVEIFFDDEIAIDVTDDLDYVGMYSKLLNLEEPIIEKNVEGNYIVFDGKGTLTEDMLNYFFSYTEFYINEANKLSTIRIHNELMATEKLGDYFYIPVEQAREKLYKGEFYTNSGYGIYENSQIVKEELVYINSRLQEYFMPYYCFYIQIEDEGFYKGHTYATFYVPAVDLETSKTFQ